MRNPHPEIPPDCPFFEKYNDEMGYRFNLPGSGGPFVWMSTDTKILDHVVLGGVTYRALISLVAQAAWANREKMLSDKYEAMSSTWVMDGKFELVKENLHDWGAAGATVQEWRDWNKPGYG